MQGVTMAEPTSIVPRDGSGDEQRAEGVLRDYLGDPWRPGRRKCGDWSANSRPGRRNSRPNCNGAHDAAATRRVPRPLRGSLRLRPPGLCNSGRRRVCPGNQPGRGQNAGRGSRGDHRLRLRRLCGTGASEGLPGACAEVAEERTEVTSEFVWWPRADGRWPCSFAACRSRVRGRTPSARRQSRTSPSSKTWGRKVRRSRAFLQTVINAIPDVLLVMGQDYRILPGESCRPRNGRRHRPDTHCLTCHQFSHHRALPCEGLR